MDAFEESLWNAPNQEAAMAILYEEWVVRESGDYYWVTADSITEALRIFANEPFDGVIDVDRAPCFMAFPKWREMSARASWRPQMVREFQLLDQGILPDSVTPHPWLLEAAITYGPDSLVLALLAVDVLVEGKHIRIAKTELLPALLSKMDIKEKDLRDLTSSRVLPYALPYLGQYATLLAKYCPVRSLRDLKANGLDISDHGNMIRALCERSCSLEIMTYLRDNTTLTPDVLDTAHETAWYWVLYADEEERQAILDSARSWRPLIELMYADGLMNDYHKPRTRAEQWCENHDGAFEDLVNLPAGIVRTIFHLRKLRLYPRGALAWRDGTLRALLGQKGEFMGRPWAALF
jgi:hypothetical protein